MMSITNVVGSGMVAFALASATVGVRLVLVARRPRPVPELAVGLAFVGWGAIALKNRP